MRRRHAFGSARSATVAHGFQHDTGRRRRTERCRHRAARRGRSPRRRARRRRFERPTAHRAERRSGTGLPGIAKGTGLPGIAEGTGLAGTGANVAKGVDFASIGRTIGGWNFSPAFVANLGSLYKPSFDLSGLGTWAHAPAVSEIGRIIAEQTIKGAPADLAVLVRPDRGRAPEQPAASRVPGPR